MAEFINILHLSDLHFNIHQEDQTIENKKKDLIDALKKKILTFTKNRNDYPNFIVISGDIAFNGVEQEFTQAKELLLDSILEELEKKINFKRENIIIVPGNHDKTIYNHDNPIARDTKTEDEIKKITNIKDQHNAIKKYDEKIEAFLRKKNTKEIRAITQRYYEEFNSFCVPYVKKLFSCNRFSTKSSKDFTCGLYDFSIQEGIIFICFNTTFLCLGGKKDHSRLIFDENFIADIKKELDSLNPNNKYPVISVMHHNPSWIKWTEKYPINGESNLSKILNFSNLILSGHEHCIKTEPDLLNNKTQLIIGGAIFDINKSIRYNFSLIKLNLKTKDFSIKSFVYDSIINNTDPWHEIDSNKKIYSYNRYINTEEDTSTIIEELKRENEILKNVIFKDELKKSIDN